MQSQRLCIADTDTFASAYISIISVGQRLCGPNKDASPPGVSSHFLYTEGIERMMVSQLR